MTNGILLILVILAVVWIASEHHPFFRRDLHNVGADIRETGRDTAASIREAVK